MTEERRIAIEELVILANRYSKNPETKIAGLVLHSLIGSMRTYHEINLYKVVRDFSIKQIELLKEEIRTKNN